MISTFFVGQRSPLYMAIWTMVTERCLNLGMRSSKTVDLKLNYWGSLALQGIVSQLSQEPLIQTTSQSTLHFHVSSSIPTPKVDWMT